MEENNSEFNIEELNKQLEECQKLRDEYLAGWQRARADFLNHKKEEMERISSLVQYSTEEFILKLLPILDSFYLAEKSLPEDKKSDENCKGLLQIKSQMIAFLKSLDVEEVRAEGLFDPNFHEVVAQEEGKGESGHIKEEIQKGYTFNGRLIRPAKVKVIK